METAKETGSKKELTAPASMVRNTANGITILPPIGAGHPVQAGRRGRRPYYTTEKTGLQVFSGWSKIEAGALGRYAGPAQKKGGNDDDQSGTGKESL